jgi:hypothetical protein
MPGFFGTHVIRGIGWIGYVGSHARLSKILERD